MQKQLTRVTLETPIYVLCFWSFFITTNENSLSQSDIITFQKTPSTILKAPLTDAEFEAIATDDILFDNVFEGIDIDADFSCDENTLQTECRDSTDRPTTGIYRQIYLHGLQMSAVETIVQLKRQIYCKNDFPIGYLMLLLVLLMLT